MSKKPRIPEYKSSRTYWGTKDKLPLNLWEKFLFLVGWRKY